MRCFIIHGKFQLVRDHHTVQEIPSTRFTGKRQQIFLRIGDYQRDNKIGQCVDLMTLTVVLPRIIS